MHSFTKLLIKSELVTLFSKCSKVPLYDRRHFSEDVTKLCVERLKNRSILSVEGRDAEEFLQKLTTNNIKDLEEPCSCQYAAFLNPIGKVLHDCIIYKPENETQYLVECDASSLDALQVHLLMCKRSKRVKVSSLEDGLKVWAIYNPEEEPVERTDLGESVLVCPDPRLPELGLRVVAPAAVNVARELAVKGHPARYRPLYRGLRYRLGVGEGALEIPYGRLTSSEANLDYLNGLSQEKGDFLGRAGCEGSRWRMGGKRLLPLLVDGGRPLPLDSPVRDAAGKRRTPVGFLRGSTGTLGIALMRVSRALDEESFRIGNVMAQCLRPQWWPDQT